MDYTKQPIRFKAQKALRYVRLFGVRRTAVKVRAQYHMERSYPQLPAQRAGRPSERHVGIIGCGKFAYAQVAYYLTKNHGAVVRGAMDLEMAHAASLFERYDLDYFTDDAERILDDPSIDLVYIASNHASHAEYAIEALERGKHVHIEKPHVVDDDQLTRLTAAMEASDGRVRLGFNRPDSEFGRAIAEELARQPGTAVFNWFVAGHEIPPDHWYFKDEEGGRVLGNLCHWTDFVQQLVPREHRFPVTIVPARAEASDSNIAVSYVFADGTIAAITFSAKGHTFEGVKERFAAHKANALITLDDFQRMTIEVGTRKRTVRGLHRDHGHERAILASYRLSKGDPGVDVAYVRETGTLFLRTREALEADERLVVERPRIPAPEGA